MSVRCPTQLVGHLLLVTAVLAGARQEAQAAETCGRAQVTGTGACEEVRVSLDLSECGGPSKVLAKVNCETLTANYTARGGAVYRARLQGKEGVWGASEWSAGPVLRVARGASVVSEASSRQPAAAFPPPATENKAPLLTKPAVAEPAAKPEDSAPPVKLSGFLDTQFVTTNRPELNKGFMLNDGALYLTKDWGNVDFKIDLPFRMYTVGGPDFQFGLTRGQAYVGQKFANGLRWKAGQFDTTYGFEANDSADVVLSRQGSVYFYSDPFVHTGLMAGYDLSSEFALNFCLANPNDRGILTGKNLQSGGQVVYNGRVRAAAGFLANPDVASGSTNFFADLVLGTTLGSLSIDAEANYNLRWDIKNPETGAETRALGGMVQASVAVTDRINAAVRGDYVTDLALTDPRGPATQSALKKQFLLMAGPQYALNKDLKIKVDYTLQSDTPFGSSNASATHGFAASAVFRY